jgi:acyl carrier protein
MNTTSGLQTTISAVINKHLHQVAPEANLDQLDPEADLGAALELDSMDFYTFLVGVSEELKVDIPEEVYGSLRSLKTIREYVEHKLSGS